MIRYRIYTELVNYAESMELAKNLLGDSFTVFHAAGVYKGKEEKSLVFEVLLATESDEPMHFAYRVKKMNQQESVLVTRDTEIGCFNV